MISFSSSGLKACSHISMENFSFPVASTSFSRGNLNRFVSNEGRGRISCKRSAVCGYGSLNTCRGSIPRIGCHSLLSRNTTAIFRDAQHGNIVHISSLSRTDHFYDLGEICEALRDSVRKFCEKEIAPNASDIDKNNLFPDGMWNKFGEMGLLGMTVPAKYGGSEMGVLEHIIVMEEISRVSGSVGLSYGAHSNLCVNQIYKHGTEEQRQKYLPKLCSGEHVGALALSEPNAGSDATSIKTTATRKDSKWIINGTKSWITNGPDANTIIVYAKTDPSLGHKGITAFIIERGMPGFSNGPKFDKMGMRGSNTSELIFDEVEVSDNHILGELNKGVYVMMSGLDMERLVLAAGPLGIMQACVDVAFPYVNIRQQFGRPIGDFQLMQGKIADMYTILSSCRSYLYTVGKAYERGDASSGDCSSVILLLAEKATWMALEAIQALGGNGYTNEYPTGRFLRDAKLYEIGAGTSEIRRIVIGRALNKFYRQ